MNLISKFSVAAFRRSFLVGFTTLFALMLFACSSNDDYEVPYKHKAPLARSVPPANIDSSDVDYWVGTGDSISILVVKWNDGLDPDELVWGYRWDSTKYGINMIYDIVKDDPRFYALFYDTNGALDSNGNLLGVALGGFGFNLSGDDTLRLVLNNTTISPDTNGIFITTSYNFDAYTVANPANHWKSGWSNSYWSYWVSDSLGSSTAIWAYSNWGASSRVLKNRSIDAWYFDANMSTFNCMNTGANCDGRTYFSDLYPIDIP